MNKILQIRITGELAKEFNYVTHKKAINKSELIPADWVGKSGHIGTYVGGGLVVEFYGGAYGCQLTELDNRCGYDFLDKRFKKGSAWTKYRRPKYYHKNVVL